MWSQLRDGNGGTIDMWVHDEGMYGSEVHPAASAVALRLKPGIVQAFFGNAVFAAHTDESDTIGLPDRGNPPNACLVDPPSRRPPRRVGFHRSPLAGGDPPGRV
ncbi:hypothetical protein Br6_05134 [Rhodococcus sp. Br-6]|nr:hypothetical protein Br6_05134 [Rhodococcus sp. Br-6]